MTDNLAEAVERVERLISTFETHGAQMIASRHIRDLRAILSSLEGDEEMVERIRKIILDCTDSDTNDANFAAREIVKAISVIGEGR